MTKLKNNEKKNTNKRKIWKIVVLVFGVIAVFLIGVLLRYILAYNGFLDKITRRGSEVKEYSVIVMEDSEAKELSDLAGGSVGFLQSDTTSANAAQYLKNQVAIETEFYDDVDILVGILEERVTDAIVLETDRFEMVKEAMEMDGAEEGIGENGDLGSSNNEKTHEMRVIYTFEVEISDNGGETVNKEITKEPFVLYISGSDSKNGVKATARSDVNIVAVVNPEQEKILLVSIPRDMYVQLHDTTGLKDKLTHAGVYGINMSKTTIEDFLGIKIDYTLKVSFETVVKVVDQLDGIEIDSDLEMTLGSEDGKKCHYVVGKQIVDGGCALRFARERKSYKTGDRHRGENQQQVITSIIGKLSQSKDYVLRIPTILDIAGDSFETTFSRDDVSEFIRMQLADRVNWKVESVSVDGTGAYEPTYSMGANLPLYVMIPSEESVKKAQDKISEYLEVEIDTTDNNNLEK